MEIVSNLSKKKLDSTGLYPDEVMQKAKATKKMPKCIFLPSRELIRRMFGTYIAHEQNYEREEEFFI